MIHNPDTSLNSPVPEIEVGVKNLPKYIQHEYILISWDFAHPASSLHTLTYTPQVSPAVNSLLIFYSNAVLGFFFNAKMKTPTTEKTYIECKPYTGF